MRLGALLTSRPSAFGLCCCLAAAFLPLLVAARDWRSHWRSERTSHKGSLLVPGPLANFKQAAAMSQVAS
jgi:hypothetical protein